jgi:hypothetical protein
LIGIPICYHEGIVPGKDSLPPDGSAGSETTARTGFAEEKYFAIIDDYPL